MFSRVADTARQHPPDRDRRAFAGGGRLAYEAALLAFYGAGALDPARPLFDIMLLGLGEDGHTASLFPGSPRSTSGDTWAVGVAQAGQPPYVPRVTLTMPALASTRLALVLVSGHAKHRALERIADGDRLPAGIAAGAGGATWIVDCAAADGEGT